MYMYNNSMCIILGVIKTAISVALGICGAYAACKGVSKVTKILKESSDEYKEEELLNRVYDLSKELHDVNVQQYVIEKEVDKLSGIVQDLYDERDETPTKTFRESSDELNVCVEIQKELRKKQFELKTKIAACKFIISDFGNYDLEYDRVADTYSLVKAYKKR